MWFDLIYSTSPSHDATVCHRDNSTLDAKFKAGKHRFPFSLVILVRHGGDWIQTSQSWGRHLTPWSLKRKFQFVSVAWACSWLCYVRACSLARQRWSVTNPVSSCVVLQGDGLEFKRHFLKIKQKLGDIISNQKVQLPATWLLFEHGCLCKTRGRTVLNRTCLLQGFGDEHVHS